ncbi:MAG: hypothetical protein JXB30_00610 [Anaerolineae bacterium]|nr:hypothetical protein [Anaerolineae bacterium]
MGKSSLRLHVISHTLWHREGLRTFQELRLGLVQFLDCVLSALATQNAFDSFVLDGQSILVEDYLEVRPEYRDMIAELIQGGRLHIGPWYILPNEFLSSPEALIRNLLLGSETTRHLGGQIDIGHVSNITAHIGQMPQILAGFGLEIASVIDDTQSDTPLKQWWFAPNGNKVLLVCLLEESDLLSLSGDSKAFSKILTRAKNRLKKRNAAQVLAILSDSRYQEAPEHIAELIVSIQGQIRGAEVVHGDLPGYLAAISKLSNDLPVIEGEILPASFSAGTFSTRIWIKQHNHAIENLLEHWAEPFSAWASLIGHADTMQDNRWLQKPNELVTHAWRLLLPNHAYLSISGHAIDQVHREMQVRFEQAEQVGAEIAGQNLQYLTSQIDTSSIPVEDSEHLVIVFNGTGQSHTGIATFEIPTSLADGRFQIVDSTGTPQPTEYIDCAEEIQTSQFHHARFLVRDVPAYGFRTYSLQPAAGSPEEMRIDDIPAIKNEYLSVSVEPSDGTFTIFDKLTGRTFSGLNRYVDGGDCGDAAAYCPPRRDTLIDIATNTPIYVERRISNTQQEMSYLQIYRLPQMLTPQRDARLPLAAQFVPIPITTTLRVVPGVPRLDVEVHISNNALDHRLRVHFPTGIRTSEVLFDGHYEIVSRPVPGDYPQRAFVTVLGTDTGLTIANQGLAEAAALITDEGVEIALTLLRSVGWLQLDNSPATQTPDAQCRGNYHFSYSLIPHGQDALPAWQQAWAFQTPLRALLTTRHPGVLPPEHSLVTVDNPAFVLTTVKVALTGEGLVVRGYSISNKVEKVSLNLGIQATQAHRTRLDETPIGKRIKPDAHGQFRLQVKPAEIVTLYFTTA